MSFLSLPMRLYRCDINFGFTDISVLCIFCSSFFLYVCSMYGAHFLSWKCLYCVSSANVFTSISTDATFFSGQGGYVEVITQIRKSKNAVKVLQLKSLCIHICEWISQLTCDTDVHILPQKRIISHLFIFANFSYIDVVLQNHQLWMKLHCGYTWYF